jgi:hypothetical protein
MDKTNRRKKVDIPKDKIIHKGMRWILGRT